jgi:hypothetical protein
MTDYQRLMKAKTAAAASNLAASIAEAEAAAQPPAAPQPWPQHMTLAERAVAIIEPQLQRTEQLFDAWRRHQEFERRAAMQMEPYED